jgi:cytochrome c oxidase cbb3-type subunit 3/ubiquinol-cytochrome c reductase cytochrome c subunit
MLLTAALMMYASGCGHAPGKPGLQPESLRPSQVLAFPALYRQNCAGCHGVSGKYGAAISLDNPVYVAFAGGSNIAAITGAGVPGTLMPPFSKASGGMLTDQQVQIIAQGIVSTWGNSADMGGQSPPPYASHLTGNPANGQKAFATFCARCHGPGGGGVRGGEHQTGSLIDPSYLALISDQGLRSIIVAGAPRQGMPDWRSDAQGAGARPLTDQEITDIVAWLGSFRVQTPGQPYGAHQ